jgi:UDP-N-acetylmuramoyl-L-alanyl-D-glutamate--2,6-diaminopimelate ligase
MNLSALLAEISDYRLHGSSEKEIQGIANDSRKVVKGGLFVATKGLTVDGHDFIREAIRRGAIAVMGERDYAKTGIPKGVTYIKVPDSRQALGEIAADWYGTNTAKLKIIGVTGTKGKTTTCHLIYHILTKAGKKAGLVSSITTAGLHTTSPDVISLHQLLSQMIKDGCEYAVIEVSSHGIDQKRIAGINFDIGVLTNIAPEHLDYHKTFEEYKRIKMSFIKSAKHSVISPTTTKLTILPGVFNNINAETAIEVAALLGIDKKTALSALHSFKLPAGRLEEIKNKLGVKIIIDFAHTPESLQEALTYLRTQTKGKLIAVFGCAGERDSAKRQKMGKISGEIADLSIFTAEDPRSENVFDILDTMKKDAKNYQVIPERGEAITAAINQAKKGDTVAIFGKGHEKSMCYGHIEHPWSDQEAVKNILMVKPIGVIVMAAGMGRRMHSEISKVMHKLAERPIVAYTLENLRQAGLKNIVMVVGYKKEQVIKQFAGAVKFAVQPVALGTADAVAKGLAQIGPHLKTVVVMNGDDSAFYTSEVITEVIKTWQTSKAVLTFVSLIKEEPLGLGRIIRDKKGDLVDIVEEKDLTEDQKKITEVNDGLYVFDRKWLGRNLAKIQKSASGEYYLVDLIKIALEEHHKVAVYKLKDNSLWQGVNTQEQLYAADLLMQKKLAKYAVN